MLSLPLARPRMAVLVPALFVATIFLSAALLFFVQPLYTKIVMPHIGGAPAVWTTAMLFFQTILIAGYLYAHLSTRYLKPRLQMAVHLALWAVALAFLPLSVQAGWSYDGEGSAAWQTLTLFALGVGLPFAVLSANAPLIQSWYGASGGPSADDPYFLYGASNLGSLVALLAFPLVAEPLLGARQIGLVWAVGFVVLGGFLFASGLCAAPGGSHRTERVAPTQISPGRIAYWGLLAFVPSSLMLAVTTKISTDFGSIPLVWVVPLALYLLTFVLSFSNRRTIGSGPMRLGLLASILGLSAIFSNVFGHHLSVWEIAALIAGFFVMSFAAHRRLYEARPDGAALTLFYVSMSVGGALGGLFNSIIAPNLFTDLTEGPITVAIAALVLLLGARRKTPMLFKEMAIWGGATAVGIALLSVAQSGPGGGHHFRDRSFFGTHKVRDRSDLRTYSNGTTLHGAQAIADLTAERPTGMLYYHPLAPMAQVLTSDVGRAADRVGIIGQGVGALACYRQPGQDWHFYEIDRTVDEVARNPDLFTFMSQCAPDSPTHLGDARVVLAGQPDLTFDVLVVDAYSSDAVPLHLTTTEAMALYLDRLNPGGLLVYHISNRYFAIDRPLSRSAEALGVSAWMQNFEGNRDKNPGIASSRVVLVARTPEDRGALAQDPRWVPLESDGGRLWTDDYANLLSILR